MDLNGPTNEEEEESGQEAEEDADGGKHEGQTVAEGQLIIWTHGLMVVHVVLHHVQHLNPQNIHDHHHQQENTWSREEKKITTYETN